MIEILRKWQDDALSKSVYYLEESYKKSEFEEVYWYWNMYANFVFSIIWDLEDLKAHDSPQKKRATMLNRVQTEAFFFQEHFYSCADQIKAQAHIDASLKLKELFTAWNPTGDPIRKYKVLSRG